MNRHRSIPPAGVFLLLAAALLLWNAPQLANPPFWDDLLGVHAQAVALARSGGDLGAVIASGDFWSGGAWIYKFGLPPFPLALLYRLLPPTAVHLIGHLFSIGCIAGAGALLYQLLRRFRLPAAAALLWSAAFAAEPVVAAQSAALGLEPPLLLAGALIVTAAAERRWFRAVAWTAAAGTVKLTAVVPAIALALYLGLRAATLPGGDRKRCAAAAGAAALLAGLLAALTFWDSDGAAAGSCSAAALAGRVLEYARNYLPLPLCGLAAAALAAAWRWRRHRKRNRSERDRLTAFLLLLLGGFWGAFFLYSVPLPRYAAFAAMPLAALLALALSPLPRGRSWLPPLAVLLTALALSGGRWYPPLPPPYRHSGEWLERSREFLDQLALDRRICAEVERRQFSPVVAKWPYVQMLALPEFGYVRRPPAELYCAGTVPRYAPNVRKYEAGGLAKRPESVYLFVCNSFEFFREFGPPLPPERGDRVAAAPAGDGALLLLYRKANVQRSAP